MSPVQDYLLALIPLFVAMDAISTVPIFLALTEAQDRRERSRTLALSVATGLVAGLAFLAVGRLVFRVLGVTIADFQVAGGAVLFAISVTDLVRSKEDRRLSNSSPGVVPLGVPLIVGPAVLTTLLILLDTYGTLPTVVSLVANLALAGAIFSRAEWVTRLLGKGGTKGLAKVMSLLLAAIGVMMIRRGVQAFLVQGFVGGMPGR